MSRSQSPSARPRKIFLFDVDGTLTKPRMKAEQHVIDFLHNLKKHAYIGFVGGSDLIKIKEQLGDNCATEFDYLFSENGLVSFRKGDTIGSTSINEYFGEERLQKFIKFCLRYIADLDIPKQRGTFVEFRTGMVNVSPIGRNCSQAERDEFEKYDQTHQIRAKMIEALKAEFPEYGLTYSVGGQISFDVFPNGWDKRYCLSFLEDDGFDEVHFFGDKTHKGGNDYEIFEDSRTIGHRVNNPEDTMSQVLKALGRTSL